ncbi:MAG: hypothetical protein HC935_01460 [Pseudanabaena sp. SU_2_4]|nr:hypothetical protein [Pseudanabaena sp. SU_2_4]
MFCTGGVYVSRAEGYKCFALEALWELRLDDKAKLLKAKLLVELVWPFLAVGRAGTDSFDAAGRAFWVDGLVERLGTDVGAVERSGVFEVNPLTDCPG